MEPFYCAAPWRGLHINFRGDVKTCCAGNPNLIGNINRESINSLLHNDIIKQIRISIRNGKPHDVYCQNCVEAERFGRSERHWHNDVNQGFDVASADLDDYRPTIVDVRWNTTCNLSCNYCNENCSSRWQSLKQKIDIRQDIKSYYHDVCDFLAQHAETIHEVALVGGEPFLLKENEKLLDVLPKHTIVTVITNTSLVLKNNRIFQKLIDRPRVGWSMSFDNLTKQFEYVRHGAHWEQLLENVALISDLMKNHGHWGGIHAVYNIYNCTRVVEFRRWARENELTIMWQTGFDPMYIAPYNFPARLRQQALEQIDLMFETFDDLSPQEIDFFGHARQSLESPPPNNVQKDFAEHIKKIETQYHCDQQGQFVALWPELAWLVES